MSWKIRITCYLGLGGMQERYTTGETLWMIALSLAIGLTLGIILVLVTGGVKC